MSELTACPECSASVLPEDFFCPSCGLLLRPEMATGEYVLTEPTIVRALLSKRPITAVTELPRPPPGREPLDSDSMATVKLSIPMDEGTVPHLSMRVDQVARPLQDIEAYVASFIDGEQTVPELAKAARLPLIEVKVVLKSLLDQRLIELRRRAGAEGAVVGVLEAALPPVPLGEEPEGSTTAHGVPALEELEELEAGQEPGFVPPPGLRTGMPVGAPEVAAPRAPAAAAAPVAPPAAVAPATAGPAEESGFVPPPGLRPGTPAAAPRAPAVPAAPAPGGESGFAPPPGLRPGAPAAAPRAPAVPAAPAPGGGSGFAPPPGLRPGAPWPPSAAPTPAVAQRLASPPAAARPPAAGAPRPGAVPAAAARPPAASAQPTPARPTPLPRQPPPSPGVASKPLGDWLFADQSGPVQEGGRPPSHFTLHKASASPATPAAPGEALRPSGVTSSVSTRLPAAPLPRSRAAMEPLEAPGPRRESTEDFLERAVRHERAGEVDKAIEVLERALSQGKQPALLYNKLALILLHQRKDYSRATQLLEKATELAPDNLVYQQNLMKVVSLAAAGAAEEDPKKKKKGGLLSSLLGRR